MNDIYTNFIHAKKKCWGAKKNYNLCVELKLSLNKAVEQKFRDIHGKMCSVSQLSMHQKLQQNITRVFCAFQIFPLTNHRDFTGHRTFFLLFRNILQITFFSHFIFVDTVNVRPTTIN